MLGLLILVVVGLSIATGSSAPGLRSRRGVGLSVRIPEPPSFDNSECVSMELLSQRCALAPEDGLRKVLFRGSCSAASYGGSQALMLTGKLGERFIAEYGDKILQSSPEAFLFSCGVGAVASLFAGFTGAVVAGTSFCVYETARLCSGVPLAGVIRDINALEDNEQ